MVRVRTCACCVGCAAGAEVRAFAGDEVFVGEVTGGSGGGGVGGGVFGRRAGGC